MSKHTGNTSQDTQSAGSGFEETGISKIYKVVEEVQFTDSSTGADSVSWDFGDGNTSTERNPLHGYTENGEYVVTLTAINEFGQSSQNQTIIVEGIGIEFYETEEEQQEEQEEQEEQQTYSEPMPSVPPPGYDAQNGIFMTDTLSPEGQWIWSGFGWVENANYDLPVDNESEETDYDLPTDNESEETEEVIYGCTDPTAMNYNPNATQENGSCQYEVFGCTDPTAMNYNPTATTNDGSCQYEVFGCTDPDAVNYNPNATTNDGSCQYQMGETNEPMPDTPPVGYDLARGILMTDTLSPEGQWIWSGFGWNPNNNTDGRKDDIKGGDNDDGGDDDGTYDGPPK